MFEFCSQHLNASIRLVFTIKGLLLSNGKIQVDFSFHIDFASMGRKLHRVYYACVGILLILWYRPLKVIEERLPAGTISWLYSPALPFSSGCVVSAFISTFPFWWGVCCLLRWRWVFVSDKINCISSVGSISGLFTEVIWGMLLFCNFCQSQPSSCKDESLHMLRLSTGLSGDRNVFFCFSVVWALLPKVRLHSGADIFPRTVSYDV